MTQPPLRVWPAILFSTAQIIGLFIVPALWPGSGIVGILSSVIGTLLIACWWLFFSRATIKEKLINAAIVAVFIALTPFILHESIATSMMGMMFTFYGIPLFGLAITIWAAAFSQKEGVQRTFALVGCLFVAALIAGSVKTGGFDSDIRHDFSFRWQTTHEQQVAETLPEANTAANLSLTQAEKPVWAGFRGERRDGKVYGSSIADNWNATPPQEMWRRPIGPGWSSFAVSGEVFFTQEQRGEEEVVACYRLDTGEPVWSHRDTTRFWESNGGAGPRGTPELVDGQIYTFGATGILNALDANTGKLLWTQHAAELINHELPGWGYASSPVVVDDVVIVAVEGVLVGFDRATGELKWQGPDWGASYASPHLFEVDGQVQVTLMARKGLLSLNPADGSILWQHEWDGRARIVQPVVLEDNSLVLSKGERTGIKRIAVKQQEQDWKIDDVWTSISMKPYFSGFVSHKGYLYGFDGGRLACIKAEDSERQWKGGRFGSGQLLMLADQDLMIVISERGELVLVKATPESYQELGKLPAVAGKTWNYPVLADDILLVRNAEEMVAYRLAEAEIEASP
jgi:outer membrane protein assembly factor BamB